MMLRSIKKLRTKRRAPSASASTDGPGTPNGGPALLHTHSGAPSGVPPSPGAGGSSDYDSRLHEVLWGASPRPGSSQNTSTEAGPATLPVPTTGGHAPSVPPAPSTAPAALVRGQKAGSPGQLAQPSLFDAGLQPSAPVRLPPSSPIMALASSHGAAAPGDSPLVVSAAAESLLSLGEGGAAPVAAFAHQLHGSAERSSLLLKSAKVAPAGDVLRRKGSRSVHFSEEHAPRPHDMVSPPSTLLFAAGGGSGSMSIAAPAQGVELASAHLKHIHMSEDDLTTTDLAGGSSSGVSAARAVSGGSGGAPWGGSGSLKQQGAAAIFSPVQGRTTAMAAEQVFQRILAQGMSSLGGGRRRSAAGGVSAPLPEVPAAAIMRLGMTSIAGSADGYDLASSARSSAAATAVYLHSNSWVSPHGAGALDNASAASRVTASGTGERIGLAPPM